MMHTVLHSHKQTDHTAPAQPHGYKAAIKWSTPGSQIWVKTDLLVSETCFQSSNAPGSYLSTPTNMLSFALIVATQACSPGRKGLENHTQLSV